MAQIFHPGANTIFRVFILAVFALTVGTVFAIKPLDRTAYLSNVDVPVNQPVQFSHKHHAGGLGIDCRFCHTTAEKSSFAGMPTTETCMTCHSQIWLNSPTLQPVRDSLISRTPLTWVRVHDLGDFVYFNHSIHVNKGVGCASCHGRVDNMQQIWKVHTLRMEWCLDCHRQPTQALRPRSDIFNMAWQPPSDPALARQQRDDLARQYHLRDQGLTNCSTCHH